MRKTIVEQVGSAFKQIRGDNDDDDDGDNDDNYHDTRCRII